MNKLKSGEEKVMTDTIQTRLRTLCQHKDNPEFLYWTGNDAADTIDTLEADNKRLRERNAILEQGQELLEWQESKGGRLG